MRKLGISVAVVAASLSVAGIAQAVDVNQGLSVKTTGKKGTKAKPAGLKMVTTTTTTGKNPAIDGTYSTKSAVIHFDKYLKFNPKSFKTCSLAIVGSDSTKCPKGSKVGTGGASATVSAGQIKVNPTIEAFNAKGGKLILRLKGRPNEVSSDGILTGTLKKDTGKYGSKLVVPIPAQLQVQLGLVITLNKFTVTIPKQKARGHYYVESIGCKGGKYNFAGDFVYSDNTKKSVKTTSKC